MREKLIITRNFLYRLFLIGFVINVIIQLLLMYAVNMQTMPQAASILHLPTTYLPELIITSIAFVRMFLFYFVLLPALALHWTIARDKHLM